MLGTLDKPLGRMRADHNIGFLVIEAGPQANCKAFTPFESEPACCTDTSSTNARGTRLPWISLNRRIAREVSTSSMQTARVQPAILSWSTCSGSEQAP
eukprot:4519807-Pyramimonas_sp.AAC.1